MKIANLFQQSGPVVSFEIFPPKKDGAIETIYQTLTDLKDHGPDFISVTYGAGGSLNNNKTLDISTVIKNDYGIEALHHLTCAHTSKTEIRGVLDTIQQAGIENILALRGDLNPEKTAPKDGFLLARDLIAEIKENYDFCVGAACYPEGHISQLSPKENTQHLKDKETAGADFFVSQLFFDNDAFYNLRDQAQKAGVKAPIVAGVMPILSRSQVEKMIFMCGSSLPADLIKLIHKYEDNLDDLRKAGLDYALQQIDGLIQQDVDGIHVYSMNRPVVAKTALSHIKERLDETK